MSTQLLLVLDQTISMKTNDAKMNAASLAQSAMDDFSIGDYMGMFIVDDHVRTICPIRRLHYKNRFDADVAWARAEAMDWDARTGHMSIHRGVETAFRAAQRFHKLSRVPLIVVVITDGSKWALSNVVTSKGFLNHIAKLPICQQNIVQMFICTATRPPTKEEGHAVTNSVFNGNSTIFNKNDKFIVYLKDISNAVQCARTKWIIRSHLHELKAQQCKSVIQNINEISGMAHASAKAPKQSPRSFGSLRLNLPRGLRPKATKATKVHVN